MTNEEPEPSVTEPPPATADQVAASNRRAFSRAARASFSVGLAWAGAYALLALTHLNRLSVIRGIPGHSATVQDLLDADLYVRWAYWARIAAAIVWIIMAVLWQRQTYRLLGIARGPRKDRQRRFHEALKRHPRTWSRYNSWRVSGWILLVVAVVLPSTMGGGDANVGSLAHLQSLELRRVIGDATLSVVILVNTKLSWRARRAIESTPFVILPPVPPRSSRPVPSRGESPTVGWPRS